jgi:hypothetical protein
MIGNEIENGLDVCRTISMVLSGWLTLLGSLLCCAAGMDVPESARMVLLQEEKFKSYYNELSFVLKEYERILSKVSRRSPQLLRPVS